MHTLFMDLASNKQFLALVCDDKSIITRKSDTRFAEDQLMLLIEALCKEARGTLTMIHRIACVTGPGGFMSQRVGAALTNALAYSLNIPITGIHQSDLWAARTTHHQLPTTHFVWLHSTKRSHVFIRGFGDYAKQWPEAILMETKELASLPENTPIAGELIEEHTALVSHCNRLTEITSIEEVLVDFLKNRTYTKEQIVPWYGRNG